MNNVFEYILKVNGTLIECDGVVVDRIASGSVVFEDEEVVKTKKVKHKGKIQPWKKFRNGSKADALKEFAVNQYNASSAVKAAAAVLYNYGVVVGVSTINTWAHDV